MAGLEPSPGLRSLVRVLLVVAFAILLLGTLVTAGVIITDTLITNAVDDITERPETENNTSLESPFHRYASESGTGVVRASDALCTENYRKY